MSNTLGFVRLRSATGGRGPVLAYGTVTSLVDGGSFSIQSQTAGSKVLRNVLAPIVSVISSTWGTAVQPEASGSSNGYIAVNLYNLGSGDGVAFRAGTVNLAFVALGGAGSV